MPTQNLSFPTRSVYTFASHIPTHFICRFALHSTLQKLKNDAYQSRYSTLTNSSVHRLIQTPGLLAARAAPANLCGREEAIYSPFSCLSISPVVVESSDSLHVLTCFTFLLFFYMYIYIYREFTLDCSSIERRRRAFSPKKRASSTAPGRFFARRAWIDVNCAEFSGRKRRRVHQPIRRVKIHPPPANK